MCTVAIAQKFSDTDSLEAALKKKIETQTLDSSACIILDTLFSSYKYRNFNRSKEICELAIKIGESNNNYYILEYWYRTLGFLYVNSEIYTVGLDYYLKGFEFAEKVGVKSNWWLINIGNISYADKNYSRAKQYYEEAIEAFTKDYSKEPLVAKKGIAVALANIGMIYNKHEKYDSALINYHKSYEIRKTIEDKSYVTFLCNLITETYIEINEFDSAKVFIERALFYDKKSANHPFLPDIFLTKSNLLFKQNEFQEALKSSKEAEKISIELENISTHIKSYQQSIKILKKLGKTEEALRYAKKASKLVKRSENHQAMAEIYNETSNLFYQLNMADSAYQYISSYLTVIDTIAKYKYSRLHNKYEIELNKAKLITVEKELEASNQKNAFYKFSIIAGLIVFSILIILFLFILKASKALKKSNKQIIKQNETISAQYEEIKQQNNTLEKYKNHLEGMVKEKTKDMHAAKERAEKADLLKTAFLENLSHEIRTPLNAIVGFSNIIGYSEGNMANIKRYIDHINNGSNALLGIIDSIMEVSNIQLGQFKPNKSLFKLSDLVEDLESNFSKINKLNTEQAIELKLKLDAPVNAKIYTDKECLSTILYKLVDNAIKYTEKGLVECGVSEKENDYLFYVKDTGVGIDEQDVKFIFDKFRKINPDKTKLYRGLGLGLTIAKSLVEELSGQIWLDSEVGKGSTFWFTLPKN